MMKSVFIYLFLCFALLELSESRRKKCNRKKEKDQTAVQFCRGAVDCDINYCVDPAKQGVICNLIGDGSPGVCGCLRSSSDSRSYIAPNPDKCQSQGQVLTDADATVPCKGDCYKNLPDQPDIKVEAWLCANTCYCNYV